MHNKMLDYNVHPYEGCIVYVGVKFVNKFASVALLCVICSIIAVYTGIFVNFDGNDKLK
jgi:potassium/chloride transporter 4/5/6